MTDAEALEYIRGCASAGRYEVTVHARLRMRQRRVQEGDLRSALSRATHCAAQPGERWRVEGPDLDEEALTVIVTIDDGLVVVTLF